jgi:hypothetical protein
MQTSENHRPPTPTISGVSRQHGIGRETVRRWIGEGLDIADDAAVKARVDHMANRSSSPDIAAARLAKIQAETRRIDFAHEVEQGKFVAGHLVEGDGQRIGFAVRSALDQLAMQLPPQLAGRTAAEILKTLRTEFRKVLDDLSHYESHIKFDP